MQTQIRGANQQTRGLQTNQVKKKGQMQEEQFNQQMIGAKIQLQNLYGVEKQINAGVGIDRRSEPTGRRKTKRETHRMRPFDEGAAAAGG